MMLRSGDWPVPDVIEPAQFLPSSEWDDHKRRLAEALEDEGTWEMLASFYYSLEKLRVYAGMQDENATLNVRDRERLQLMHDQAMVLRGVLGGDKSLPADWHDQVKALREAGELPPAGERAK